ncbi:MAG: dienelactone hydrolase family protein [Thaumarchaeota archaeon]|nr:dienelactone hydrolase family protein [Nitrososphaerota archaeon]
MVSEVEVESYSIPLPGILTLPRENPRAVVVFAHGSGSSRLSPRNAYVATVLHESGFGTLLFDLLTEQEDAVYDNRFDIDLLAERLTAATQWLHEHEGLADLSVGYFGASTGAAAALQASVKRPDVRAVVSRGGRPDLAWDYVDRVEAPTLLVVGGRDDRAVLEFNERALARLNTGERKDNELVIVPGATHLFEEPGTLEEVARIATQWFLRFLG